MYFYAEIQNGICIGVISIPHPKEKKFTNLIEISSFNEDLIGCEYKNGKFEKVKKIREESTISRFAFMTRFTREERLTIREKAKIDVVIEDFLDLLSSADEVDLKSDLLKEGMKYLVDIDIITNKRKKEIMTIREI